MSKATCETCLYFAAGKTDGLMHLHLRMLGGASPSNADVLAYKAHNKDGQCNLDPRPVSKLKRDFCSHHSPVGAKA